LAYQPSVLFVNGEYWGIHNLREKTGKSYLEENHGADPSKTNLIFGLGDAADHGNIKGYQELFNFLTVHSPNEKGFIDSVEKRMDIDNYFKYLCLQIQINNPDSRGNVRYWQAKNLDNRFRWIYYDGDLGFGTVAKDYLKDRLSPVKTFWHNPPATTFLLRHLTANPLLRDRFISQYCTLLSTWLHGDTVSNRIEFFKSWLEPEIDRHLTRRTFRQSKSNWLTRISKLKQFAQTRMLLTYEHLKSNFKLGDRYQLTLKSNIPGDKIRYAIERIPIPSLPYKGIFFKEARVNVSIDFLHPRYRFVNWDNGSKDAVRMLLNPADSIVEIMAHLVETPASKQKGKYWINRIGHGKKEQPVFIEINGYGAVSDTLVLVDSERNYSIPLSNVSLPVVITKDTLAFKKVFPTASIKLIQYPELKVKNMGKTIYLMEPTGAWVDSVDLLEWNDNNRKKPYWVRNNKGKLKISDATPTFEKASRWYSRRPTWLVIGTALALVVIMFIWYVMRKNKKAIVRPFVLLILITARSVVFAQTEDTVPVKSRQVDVSILKKSPLINKGVNRIVDEAGFYRVYEAVAEPLIWVAPFPASDVFEGDWHKLYTQQTLKELPADPFSMKHMRFRDQSVRCWIAGDKIDFFLIDSIKKIFLARVDHRNGMESWYYPILQPNRSAATNRPGILLGTTGGFYFWQLRYRSCSVYASAIIQSNGRPDPKGFVLENLCPNIVDVSGRIKNFSKSLSQKINEEELKGNWEKALEEELKKQQ
jgi:hypothetical protein